MWLLLGMRIYIMPCSFFVNLAFRYYTYTNLKMCCLQSSLSQKFFEIYLTFMVPNLPMNTTFEGILPH